MKKNKKPVLAPPYAAETKDARFAGTFEVFVPVPDKVKAQRVGMQFETLASAESWIHSPDGEDAIARILSQSNS